MNFLQKILHPLPKKNKDIEIALRRACAFTAKDLADGLRNRQLQSEVEEVCQILGGSLPTLDTERIDSFQKRLEDLIYDQISKLEYYPDDPDLACRSFDRWVGSYDYFPNTYLRQVAEEVDIPVVYFPAQKGWYVNPARVFTRNGEELSV